MGGRALVCLLLSAAVSDLTESPVFMRVPRAANRSKVVAKLVARGAHFGPLLWIQFFLTLKTAEKRLVAACMQSEREPRRRMHEMVAGPVHSKEEW